MKTNRLDGLQLEKMLRNGLANLTNNEERINDLNVFPVADGDTGTNMRLTLEHGLKDAKNIRPVGAFLKALTDGMLMGARGNSGVILSQIFRGIFLELQHAGYINAVELRDAFIRGYKTAYGAVARPVEGTILTVAREGIENIRNQISRGISIDSLLGIYLAEMKKSLQRTPELLPELKEAGVIDSGADGYITIVEGMQKWLFGEYIDARATKEMPETNAQVAVDETIFNENSAFDDGYCCEFILQLMKTEGYTRSFREATFISDLSSYGNSIVVVKNGLRVKVHVHTMKPGRILALAQEYGEFLTLKIENMQIQHVINDLKVGKKKAPIHKPVASVAVANGDGFKKLFTDLGCDIVLDGGMTMNTSAEDFVRAFRQLDADVIVAFPNHKNILMAAEQAKQLCPELDIRIIPCKSQPSCYAALQMDIQDSSDTDYRLECMDKGAKRAFGIQVSRATRSILQGQVPVVEGDFILLAGGEIVASGTDLYELISKAVAHIPDMDDRETLLVFTGSGATDEMNDIITEKISELYPLMDIIFMEGGQPVYPYVLGFI